MLGLSAILLNLGLVFAIIPNHPATAAIFTLALLASLVGIFLPHLGALSRARRRHVVGLLGAGVIAQLLLILRLAPGYALDPPFLAAEVPFYGGVLVIGVIVLAVLLRPPVQRRFDPAFLAVLGVYLIMGAWLIAISPEPPMDVHIFQKQGAEALLRGENPYSITTYPDLYGEGSGLYAPGLVEDGHLTFGFTYPPLSLLMALPGHVIGGDYRYVQLGSMGLAALLTVSIAPGKLATLAALLMLLNPRGFFVLEAGWTDPYALLLVALVTWLAVRRSPLLPIALGLLSGIKQHFVLALPLALAALDGGWPPARRWRLAAVAAATALLVTLPMALWDLEDFLWSTVFVHIEQPFRPDSLSYLAWFGSDGQPWLPTWVGFVVLVPTAAAVLWRLGRSTASFVTAMALMYFIFFLFSKQAFVHYYYFVMGTICIAIAGWIESRIEADSVSPTRWLKTVST